MWRRQTYWTADRAPVGVPPVVDRDGSLIGGDLLIERIVRLLSVSWLSLFALPFCLAAAKAQGRAVRLTSVAAECAATLLAETVGADGGLSRFGRTSNLEGETKAVAPVVRFGENGFDCIGNQQRGLAVRTRTLRLIYLAKDASCAPERVREGYPRFGVFEAMRADAAGRAAHVRLYALAEE